MSTNIVPKLKFSKFSTNDEFPKSRGSTTIKHARMSQNTRYETSISNYEPEIILRRPKLRGVTVHQSVRIRPGNLRALRSSINDRPRPYGVS